MSILQFASFYNKIFLIILNSFLMKLRPAVLFHSSLLIVGSPLSITGIIPALYNIDSQVVIPNLTV